jgi:hypothetical protein
LQRAARPRHCLNLLKERSLLLHASDQVTDWYVARAMEAECLTETNAIS